VDAERPFAPFPRRVEVEVDYLFMKERLQIGNYSPISMAFLQSSTPPSSVLSPLIRSLIIYHFLQYPADLLRIRSGILNTGKLAKTSVAPLNRRLLSLRFQVRILNRSKLFHFHHLPSLFLPASRDFPLQPHLKAQFPTHYCKISLPLRIFS